MNRRHTVHLLAFIVAAAAVPASAQDVYWQKHTGGYAMLGFGGGNFTLSCDTGCGSNELSSSNATLMLGRHFNPRLRGELGFTYQSNRDSASNAFTAQLGAAFYLISGLYVRGGVTYQNTSVEQASGTYEGKGGPGFSAGAGFDLHLGRTFALTPFVNYTSASLSTINITTGGGGSTAGSIKALTFGVSASIIRGTWICVTAAGERIRVTPANRSRALTCLNEVERRLGRPSGVKQ